VLTHAPTPKNPSIERRPTTYGGLVDAACLAVKEAVLLPRTGTITVDEAWPELLGYQRFVRTCGIHLRLLTRFQLDVTPEQRRLIDQLIAVPLREAGPSSWMRAAQTLGAAHDLFTTHLDPQQQPRTAEIEDLLTPSSVLVPMHTITSLLLDAVDAGTHLVDATVEAQRALSPRPVAYPQLRALRNWTRGVRPYAKAAHLDVSALVAGDGHSAISRLEPAPLVQVSPLAGSEFDSTLDALRILRQLTIAQAKGKLAASPTSLRDLAVLGAAASSPTLSWLPDPRTNLERLQRAQARDLLETSHAAWNRAAADLTESILGLTRAPREYATAIAKIGDPEGLAPSVRVACISALPRLGQDAAGAIGELASRNALVERRREPGHLSMVWRPLTPAAAEELANRFRTAASHSETTALTLRRGLATPTAVQRSAIEPLDRPAPRHELELSRTVRR
jgi:hypothetical protein